METSPFFSVCVAIWNVEQYIERCLRSLFEQTMAEKAEFILVNDCTPDNSMVIVSKVVSEYPELEDQIHIINHEKNEGLANARNSALSFATGKYIQWIDSDDWCDKQCLEKVYRIIQTCDPDVIGYNFYFTDGIHHKPMSGFLPHSNIECLRSLLKTNNEARLWIKVVKRDLLISNNIYSEPCVDLGEDTLLSAKIFCHAKKIVSLEDYLYYHTVSNKNSLGKKKDDSFLEHLFKVYSFTSSYLYEYSRYDLLDEDLLYMKLRLKLEILSKTLHRYKYYGLWPETGVIIWKSPYLTFINRLWLWCGSHKLQLVSECIFFLKYIKRKFVFYL